MIQRLIKRYMMAHYNMTAVECLPKTVQTAIKGDKTLIRTITKQLNETRLIPKSEFVSLCNHVKVSKLL